MVDVQLLVVNRNDRKQVCGIGEIGEIYPRAAGLAEEYLKLPDLTIAQKFVSNWFADDAKWNQQLADGDRSEPWRKHWFGAVTDYTELVITVDTGQMVMSNVICKIADSRFEGSDLNSGEIDTHNLSQHPMHRENVTLVPEIETKRCIISYCCLLIKLTSTRKMEGIEDPIVPGSYFYQQIKDIKTYLRTKLASYAVPTVIVSLSEIPLNPNGKVDKPKLPFQTLSNWLLLQRNLPIKTDLKKDWSSLPKRKCKFENCGLKFAQEPVSIKSGTTRFGRSFYFSYTDDF